MKITIGCLNSKYIHASLSPWCLLSGIKAFCKSDINASVAESTINANLDEFANQIEKADVYAFSCYIWNIQETLYVCEKLKQKFGSKIILGGPEVAYRAQDVLTKFCYIDFVLSGEGEFNLPKLIDALNQNLPLNEIDGLTYREHSSILSIPEAVYQETPPNPYCKEFFQNLGGRICYIETSRGCPYRCAFCLSGRCSPLRFFDIDTVKENIILLANSGTKTVKFVDRTFNANYLRANEILLFLKENYGAKIPRGVCFHFEIAGDILHEETLKILSEMPRGAVQLEIGMQSFNEKTLKTINRKTDTKKLVKNIKTLLSFDNMHIHIDLIAGLTGEDIQGSTNDKFVTLEFYHKQGEEQPHQNAHQYRRQHTQPGRARRPTHRHSGKGTHKNHAVHTDVHDSGVFGHGATGCRQRHGGGTAEHLLEQPHRK